MIREVVLVYNPSSGSAPDLRELKRLCKSHGIAVRRSIVIADGYEQTLKRSLKRRTCVMAVGGDGTISSVASQLIGTSAILMPIPGGTLNHFTKDLGIPQAVDEAIQALARGTERRVDVASVNGMYFLNNSSLGLYPQSLRTRARLEDRFGKWPAAVVGLVRAWIRFRVYTVEIDGEILETPFVFVGNNRYRLNGLEPPHRTRLDGGKLAVYIVNAATRGQLMKLFWAALRGKLTVEATFDQRLLRRCTIRARSSRHISISHDGELSKLTPPLEYTLHPAALRIIA